MVAMQPGQCVTVVVEKPAVGGRMIARLDGRVVLVGGAVPGERVSARIERVAKGVLYADTVDVLDPSADRREPAADPRCGGCLYAHIAYLRQVEIKAQVIADALARIGRFRRTEPIVVTPSPADGYRMRARLHRQGSRLGFFVEGTHAICDVRPTGQLRAETCDVIDRLGAALARRPSDAVGEVEISENIDGSQRVVHLHGVAPDDVASDLLAAVGGLTGLTVSTPAGPTTLTGSPYVTDRIRLMDGADLSFRRHVLSFFQGNRFLVADLVAHVAGLIPEGSRVIDLYAGGGLFSVAAAVTRRAGVVAVEGDPVAAADLAANAAAADPAVRPIHRAVETFLRDRQETADIIVADPPRAGLSKEALAGMIAVGPGRMVYVSCDVATLARDARRLVDAGYELTRVDGFDLFPNTPHVEAVVTLQSTEART